MHDGTLMMLTVVPAPHARMRRTPSSRETATDTPKSAASPSRRGHAGDGEREALVFIDLAAQDFFSLADEGRV